jgi:hypothetical protein
LGERRAPVVDSGIEIALNGLGDGDVLGRGDFRSRNRCQQLNLRQIGREEVDIVEPRAREIERPHALHHQAVAVSVDTETGPYPTPESADGSPFARRGMMEHDFTMQFDLVAGAVDRGVQRWMDHRDVITFEVILHIGFPVAADFMARMAQRPESLDRHRARAFGKRSDHGCERRRIRIDVDEQKTAPVLAERRDQAIFARVEIRGRSKIPALPSRPSSA